MDGDFADDYGDPDLAEAANVGHELTNDHCVLEFKVTTTVAGYIQLKVVFASDEYPEWLTQGPESGVFDDTFGVFIVAEGQAIAPHEDNIAAFRHMDHDSMQVFDMPFSMNACQINDQLFLVNQSYPANGQFTGKPHYNHEYDFFTKKLLIESRKAFPPGTYDVKIVIHDAAANSQLIDDYVDSTIFIEGDSFRLNSAPLITGDYNANGSVEQADLDLVLLNWGDPANPPPAGWIHDLPTGTIDQDELDRVLLNWGKEERRGDFDRDGDVDAADEAIWNEFNGMVGCTLRTLGDADDDGDVDECDRHWYEFERGLRPAPPTLPADNCNALAMHDAAGDTYYIVDGDAALEPIPQPQFVVVEEGYYPYPRSRAVAVAQILLIAETRWYGGRPEDALHIWAGMTRVYGKQIIPEWAASLLD